MPKTKKTVFNVNCYVCNKVFKTNDHKRTLCSKCVVATKHAMSLIDKPKAKYCPTCVHCRKMFPALTRGKRTCSTCKRLREEGNKPCKKCRKLCDDLSKRGLCIECDPGEGKQARNHSDSYPQPVVNIVEGVLDVDYLLSNVLKIAADIDNRTPGAYRIAKDVIKVKREMLAFVEAKLDEIYG